MLRCDSNRVVDPFSGSYSSLDGATRLDDCRLHNIVLTS